MARKSRKQQLNKESNIKIISVENSSIVSRIQTGAYVRLSVKNSGHDTDDSIQNQIQLVETFIKNNEEFELVETYIDNGFTGTEFDRPEFVRMMNDVKIGRIQCIIVKDLSRFGRNYLEAGYYIENIFPLLNVRFIAINDHFDNTRDEDLNAISVPIKNMVNAMYAKDISRKISATKQMQIESGHVNRSVECYGYKFDEDQERLIVDENVEPFVRLLFYWHFLGVRNTEIAQRMNLIGAPKPRENSVNVNKGWMRVTVRNILYNPTYAGYLTVRKSSQSKYKNKQKKKLERNKWLMFPDYHEAYITKEQFKEIEKVIEYNRKETREEYLLHDDLRKESPQYLKNKVYCMECRKKMRIRRNFTKKQIHNITDTFFCDKRNKTVPCKTEPIQQNYLIMTVMKQINYLIELVLKRDELIKGLERNVNPKGQIPSLERKIYRLKEKENELDNKLLASYAHFTEGLLDEEEYKYVKNKMMKEKDEIILEREEFERKLFNIKNSIEKYHELAKNMANHLGQLEINQRIIDEFIDKIFVGSENKIEIIFKCKDVFDNEYLNEFINSSESVGDN